MERDNLTNLVCRGDRVMQGTEDKVLGSVLILLT